MLQILMTLLALSAGAIVLGARAAVLHLRGRGRRTVRVQLGGRRAVLVAPPVRLALPRAASARDRWDSGELPTQALLAHLVAQSSPGSARHRLVDDDAPQLALV